MHDLVGVVLPLRRSGDTPFQGMSPINVGDLRQVSQVEYPVLHLIDLYCLNFIPFQSI